MELNTLFDNPGSKKKRKRVGRGIGSGKGKTCGRGVKGQKSRAGVAIKGFEGGQTSIVKRLPKRGFCRFNAFSYQVLNIHDINSLLESGKLDAAQIINKAALVSAGIIKNTRVLVKLLLLGSAIADDIKLRHKLIIQLDAYSASAKEAIHNAGGQIL